MFDPQIPMSKAELTVWASVRSGAFGKNVLGDSDLLERAFKPVLIPFQWALDHMDDIDLDRVDFALIEEVIEQVNTVIGVAYRTGVEFDTLNTMLSSLVQDEDSRESLMVRLLKAVGETE